MTAQADAGQQTRAGAAGLPRQAVRRLRASAATSPGRLSMMLVGLVTLSLLLGVLSTIMVSGRQGGLDDLVRHREPMNAASQQVYRSLTDAEASSAAAFLSGDAGASRLRNRYQSDLKRVGSALSVAGAEQQQGKGNPVRDLSTLLPSYAGMLETASASNQQDPQTGARYLVQASSLLHQNMLPPAQALYRNQVLQLAGEEDSATAVPWLSAGVALLLLVALFGAARYLSRRTHRTFNAGLVVASASVVLLVVWSAVALSIASAQVSTGRADGSQQVQKLSRVRLLAVQARANETLALVASDAGSYERDFQDLTSKLTGTGGKGGLFDAAVANASGTAGARHVRAGRDALRQWLGAHKLLRAKDTAGQGQQAVQIAVGASGDSAEARFGQVDRQLGSAIESARAEFVSSNKTAHNVLTGLNIGTIVLCLVAAAGAAGGIWQRLREYR